MTALPLSGMLGLGPDSCLAGSTRAVRNRDACMSRVIRCTECGAENEAGRLRCSQCDAWLPNDSPDVDTQPAPSPVGFAPTAGADDATIRTPIPGAFSADGGGNGAATQERPTLERPAADPSSSNSCPSCGDALQPDWRFCKHCGCELRTSDGTVITEPTRPGPPGAAAAPPPPADSHLSHFVHRLAADGTTVRERHELKSGRTVVGRTEGDIVMAHDPALSARHCCFELRSDAVYLRDLDSTNGTFIAVQGAEPVAVGSVLLIGSQRFLLRARRGDRDRVDLVQVLPMGETGRVHPLERDHLVIGKSRSADISFPEDGFMSRRHAELVRGSRGLAVRDLGSTNRTYVIVDGRRELEAGDRIVVGEHLLQYERHDA
ncbi:MAG: FHA domain-containing protein [Acidobacteriota bacterium]